MSYVIADDDNYKITIGIVKDFINGDYENFLENGLKDDPKIITWEMIIFLKSLNDKDIDYVNFHLVQMRRLLENEIFKYQYFKYEITETNEISTTITEDSTDSDYFISCNYQICKNPAFVKIIFYCQESKLITIPLEKLVYDPCVDKLNYLFNLSCLPYLICKVIATKSEYAKLSYKQINYTIPNFNSVCDRSYLLEIVMFHYNLIIQNIKNYYLMIKDNLTEEKDDKYNFHYVCLLKYLELVYKLYMPS